MELWKPTQSFHVGATCATASGTTETAPFKMKASLSHPPTSSVLSSSLYKQSGDIIVIPLNTRVESSAVLSHTRLNFLFLKTQF